MNTITRPITDPFVFLKEDHKKVDALFEKIEETTEAAEKTREDLFTKLNEALTVHAELEEALLYPVLEKHEETHELTKEAEEEHHVVKVLLAELEALDKDTEEWSAKAKVLMENVQHHVKEEEEELFPKAKKVIPQEDQDTLATDMEDFLKERGV